MGEMPAPSSWRDVYALVRDTRADVLVAVEKVDAKATDLQRRVARIEDDRLAEQSERRAQGQLIGSLTNTGRATISLIVSVIAGIAAFLGIASR